LTLALGALLAAGGLLATGGCVASGLDTTQPTTDPSTARRQLAELAVAKPASMRGYSRDRFPHWRASGANCNVRDRVLRRDAAEVRLDGCNVVDGRWLSAYDDRTFTAPNQIDIDHVVPLANAWRSGAAAWSDRRRGDFANDLRTPALIAVSRTTNRAKGDQDPSQWKPPNRGYWCRYAQSWIAVKHHWRLSVTAREKAALEDMLETCPWQSSERPTSSRAPAA
jgi:hypothetical protein